MKKPALLRDLEKLTYLKAVFVVAILSVLVASLPAQNGEFPPDLKSAEQEIMEVESRRFHAMLEADTGALARILADDLTYTHSSARTDTKAQFIASLQSGELKYESISTDGVKVRIYGGVAVVTGQGSMKVKSKGQDLDFRVRYTDVYVKRRGQWQMVAWQSTRIAP